MTERTTTEHEAAFGRLLFEGSNIAVAIDADGRYACVNDAWERLLGWTRAETVGRKFDEFMHPDDLPVASASFNTLVSSAPWAGDETRVRVKGGGFVRFSWSARFEKESAVLYATARDVTAERALYALMEDAIAATSAVAGTDFFGTCVEEIARAFDLDLAALSEFGAGDARDLAIVWRNDAHGVCKPTDAEAVRLRAPRFVAALREPAIALESAINAFPDDAGLAEINARAAAYFPVIGPEGRAVAAFRFGSRSGFKHPQALATAARLLGSRVAVELQRIAREDRLRGLERSVREQSAFFRSTLDHIPVSVYVKNKDLKRIFVNRAYAELHGRAAEDMVGSDSDADFPAEQAERVRASERKALLHGRTDQSEEVFTIAGRNVILSIKRFPLLDESGAAWAVGGVALDVTELRSTEESLRRNLEYSNALLRASPDLLFVMDEDFAIRDWFCQNENDLMMRPPEFVGRRMDEILPSQVGADLRAAAERARASGRPVAFEYRVPTFGGVKDFEGRVVAPVNGQTLLVVRDITEQKTLEVRVLASSKMAALGEMAAALAHEINNPLTVVFGRSQQLLDAVSTGKSNPENTADAAERIHRTAARIAKTVSALRSFARDGRRDPFELKQISIIIDDTLELCSARFRHHGIRLDVASTAGPETVECRPTQISQVLLNLLGNAFDAVTDVEDRERRWVRIEASLREEFVEFAVLDGGDGPPEDAVGRIMLPFFTTKGPGQGTGLGLSISRGLAEEHGGSLTFTREAGVTKFTLSLPKRQR